MREAVRSKILGDIGSKIFIKKVFKKAPWIYIYIYIYKHEQKESRKIY